MTYVMFCTNNLKNTLLPLKTATLMANVLAIPHITPHFTARFIVSTPLYLRFTAVRGCRLCMPVPIMENILKKLWFAKHKINKIYVLKRIPCYIHLFCVLKNLLIPVFDAKTLGNPPSLYQWHDPKTSNSDQHHGRRTLEHHATLAKRQMQQNTFTAEKKKPKLHPIRINPILLGLYGSL